MGKMYLCLLWKKAILYEMTYILIIKKNIP